MYGTSKENVICTECGTRFVETQGCVKSLFSICPKCKFPEDCICELPLSVDPLCPIHGLYVESIEDG